MQKLYTSFCVHPTNTLYFIHGKVNGMTSLADTTLTQPTTLPRQLLSPAAAQKQVEQVIRAHSKTFFFATALLPVGARQAIRALYGFCRATDDLVDAAEQCCTGIEEVSAWRAQVDLPEYQQTNPILYTWSRVRQAYGVNRLYEKQLIDGVSMDIEFRPYATWAELENYCYHVASTVGLLSMPIIGLARDSSFTEAAPYAVRLGVALQLTNILRDVGEDARHGRVYLPLEDLSRFGLTLVDILNEVYDERFIALMRFEIARARQLFRMALPGIRLLSPSARPAVGAAAWLYRAILDEIEAIDYQVFQKRAHTSGPKKLLMLPGILLTIWTMKKPS
jgi:15-cis-phytoene synthase